jgi:GPH family glycoside/pentoside/hexuronide:cation symporter
MRDEHVPFATKVLYGAGDLTTSLLTTILAFNVLYFLTDVVGIDPALVALTIFMGRGIDWINDPIIGHLSDRTRTRWGRRRPFLLLGIAPLALTFIFFFWTPPWSNQVALAVYYGVMYMLLDTAATFVYMPYYALTPELTLDYDERTSLNTARMVFSILGGLLAAVLPPMVVQAFPDRRLGYFVMAMVFGSVGVLPLLLTFFGTRERPEHIAQEQPSLRESLNAVHGNQPFLFGLGIFLVTWTVIDMLSALLLYFVDHWLQRGRDFEIIVGSMFVSAAIFLPLWNWVSGRWDKRIAYIAGMASLVAVLVILIFVQPGTPLPIIFGITSLAGIGVAAAHVVPWAILPDAIEWDELRTGQRHEGAFYSLVTLAQKIASWLVLTTLPLILKASGYVSGSTQQPASALTAIRALMGFAPAVILGLGVVFAISYPLSRERHTEIVRELARRRAQAAADR